MYKREAIFHDFGKLEVIFRWVLAIGMYQRVQITLTGPVEPFAAMKSQDRSTYHFVLNQAIQERFKETIKWLTEE